MYVPSITNCPINITLLLTSSITLSHLQSLYLLAITIQLYCNYYHYNTSADMSPTDEQHDARQDQQDHQDQQDQHGQQDITTDPNTLQTSQTPPPPGLSPSSSRTDTTDSEPRDYPTTLTHIPLRPSPNATPTNLNCPSNDPHVIARQYVNSMWDKWATFTTSVNNERRRTGFPPAYDAEGMKKALYKLLGLELADREAATGRRDAERSWPVRSKILYYDRGM